MSDYCPLVEKLEYGIAKLFFFFPSFFFFEDHSLGNTEKVDASALPSDLIMMCFIHIFIKYYDYEYQ